MTILRMTASFGRLHNAVLDLHGGLNVLTLPNEGGKSTWSAFLLAMFYGIDTGERAKAGSIPAKTKYKPWSGAPMEGTIELERDGTVIVLERTSRGRTPMGQFRAYEKESGAPVAGLNGENCGQVLLGVERSVFERSAFVRQLGLAVGADSALETRLSALVTSGEENVSAAETAKRLREWKNRIRHNKTGLLPEAQQRLAAVQGALAQLHAVHTEELTLRSRQQALETRQRELQMVRSGLEAAEIQEKLQQKYDAKAALLAANNRLAGAQARTGRLPDRAALTELAGRIRTVESMEIPPQPAPAGPAPVCPEAFRGVPEEQLMEQAARDGREFDRLTAVRRRPAVWGALAFVLCAAAAVLAVLWKQSPALGAALLALAVLGGVKWLLDRRHNRQYEANLDAAQALLARYEQHSRDEFSAFAAAYREQLMRWRQQTETQAREQAQRRRMLDERARQAAQLTGSAAMLRPGVTDMDGAAQAVAAALAEWDGLDAARQEAARAKLRYDTVCAALAGVEERPAPACDLHGWTMPGVQAELTRTELELSSLRSRLDLSRGRLEALGDPAMLAAEQETLGGRIAELEQTYAALELAEQALQDAAAELQSRFSPALTQEAGRLFAAVTGGKYDRMLLSRQMDVEAGETAQPSLRPGGYLSAGTQDALYLALRLAVCRLALPEGTPLVLDDALVCFDDARLRSALTLLRGLGATRQILLFTCQSREAALA